MVDLQQESSNRSRLLDRPLLVVICSDSPCPEAIGTGFIPLYGMVCIGDGDAFIGHDINAVVDAHSVPTTMESRSGGPYTPSGASHEQPPSAIYERRTGSRKRFIIYKPKLLGGVSFNDHRWLDLKDAKVKEGMMTASISFVTTAGGKLEIENLPKAQARKVYTFAQEMEERASSERRGRDLEERRAMAGGVQVGFAAPVPQASAAPLPVADDPLAKLTKLKSMLDAGLINQDEFNAKKNDLLAAM